MIRLNAWRVVFGFGNFTFTNLGGLQAGTYKLITSGNPVSGTLDPADLSGAIGAFTGTLQINGNDLELVVTATGGGNTFADWIGGYAGVGTFTGFNDDADGDGNKNGVENFLGTDPSVFSAGVVAGTKSGSTFTFTHPQNATPASDVTAAYRWTKDLATFHASGATDGAGTTVTFTTQPNTPGAGTTTPSRPPSPAPPPPSCSPS